jgi:NADH dehydrogenase FAD-containing subunit
LEPSRRAASATAPSRLSKTVIWTAGVTPSLPGKWLHTATDHAGRVRVQPDLTVSDHPEIFVVGDTASLDQDGHVVSEYSTEPGSCGW